MGSEKIKGSFMPNGVQDVIGSGLILIIFLLMSYFSAAYITEHYLLKNSCSQLIDEALKVANDSIKQTNRCLQGWEETINLGESYKQNLEECEKTKL